MQRDPQESPCQPKKEAIATPQAEGADEEAGHGLEQPLPASTLPAEPPGARPQDGGGAGE